MSELPIRPGENDDLSDDASEQEPSYGGMGDDLEDEDFTSTSI